jgi:CO dehydrogenase/acetyl-CoA synthase delta subunit
VTSPASGAAGNVPVVATKLTSRDRWGTTRVRCGIGRGKYSVAPGLYAVGSPDAASPVLVTANYKSSFDRLRRAMDGRSVWLLVLDTKGINVWCAAGEGTFGTEEVVRRVEETGLARVVAHRTLILPQLSAPGVAAHVVTKRSGFKVIFGPIRAEDLPAFLDAGLRATPEMRRVRFGFRDRLVLTPIEVVSVVRHPVFLVLIGLWILNRLWPKFPALDLPALVGAVLIGTVAMPVLLPWIPGRAFAWKGWLLGLGWAIAVCVLRGVPTSSGAGWAKALSDILLLPAVSAFLAMNFTGSTTFTSLSGVVREMKYAVPLIILSAVLGLTATAAGFFIR